MVRTIVYDTPEINAEYGAATRAQRPGRLAIKTRRQIRNQVRVKAAKKAVEAESAHQPQPDSLQIKLVKYVPAEVVSISAAGFAAFNPTGNWVWFGLALGAVANVIYLFVAGAQASDEAPRPRWYFYLLSASAFFVWSVATIASIQGSMHLTEAKASFILFAGAFGIPLLDSLFGVLDLSLGAWTQTAKGR